MTQRKPSRPTRPPLQPAVPTAKTAQAIPGGLPMMIWVCLAGLIICQQVIVLWFTPYTYLLDEIKVTLFFTMGPLLMLGACAAILFKQAPVPSRSIWLGLLAYMAIVVLSTFVSRYPWIGKYYIVFTWSALGFFLTAFAISAWRLGGRFMIRVLACLLLVEVLIGLFLYDVTTSPEHRSGIAIFKYLLYGSAQPYNPSPFYYLVDTLVRADDTLQSTILNRDFFAGFCCMLVPFAYLLSIHPGSTRYSKLWRTVGIVTSILGSLTIFLCQSKGEWFVWIFALLFFIAMCFQIGIFHLSDLKRGHLMAWIIGVVLLLGAVGWMKSPTLLFQLKSTGASLESREIIWNGAWRIWKDDLPADRKQGAVHNIVFGSGPGTFRIYFSGVRRPDYYLHGINNVTTLSHNYFLDVLSETGLLGMVAFGIFLGGLFGLGLRHALKRNNSLEIRLSLAAAITGLMSIFGSNMTSPSARWVIVATPMWVVMGVLGGLIYQAQKGPFESAADVPDSAGQPADTPARLLLRYVPLVLLIAAVPMLYWGGVSGVRYYDSLKRYAVGLSYLETGSNMLKTETNPDTLIAYFNESIKHFDDAIKVDRTNTSAYYKVGSAYTSLSQIYAQMAETLTAQGKISEAAQYMKQGDANLNEAKRSYETLMDYDPDYAEIHYNMGIIYQLCAAMIERGIANHVPGEEFTPARMQEYEAKALYHLEKMEKVSIKPEVATMLGNQYMSMGRFDKARDVYRDASHRPSADKDIILSYYSNALKAGDPAGACDALELLWTRHPGRNDWLEQLIQLAHQNNFNTVLERVVARLEHINPIHPRLFEARAWLAAAQNKTAEVAALVDEYQRTGGLDPAVLKLGAEAAERSGNPARAAALYLTLSQVDKTSGGQAAAKWLKDHAVEVKKPTASVPTTSSAITVKSGNQSSTPGAPAR